jgi:hypothetical protein
MYFGVPACYANILVTLTTQYSQILFFITGIADGHLFYYMGIFYIPSRAACNAYHDTISNPIIAAAIPTISNIIINADPEDASATIFA